MGCNTGRIYYPLSQENTLPYLYTFFRNLNNMCTEYRYKAGIKPTKLFFKLRGLIALWLAKILALLCTLLYQLHELDSFSWRHVSKIFLYMCTLHFSNT